MNIIQMKVKDIIPYKKNAKAHDQIQIDNVAESIKRFGFAQPLVVDKDNNLIIGHCRLLAAKKLKLKEVPTVKMDDLTEEQVKQLRLLDNKLNESDWDLELLIDELKDLDFDGFEIDWGIPSIDDLEEDEGYYGDERERTYDAYNMALTDHVFRTDDFWQMPIIKRENYIPSDLIGFKYAMQCPDKNIGLHCYIDDYQFERLWNDPDKYIDMIKEFECFLSPDFSLYLDMDMPLKIWNTYRSRLIGAYYQSKGIKVIPTVGWAEKETFDFCFKGIEKGSVVSISTIGVKENAEAKKIWEDGVTEMIKQIEPSAILVYGGKLDFDYGNIKIVYYENHNTAMWGGKKDEGN